MTRPIPRPPPVTSAVVPWSPRPNGSVLDTSPLYHEIGERGRDPNGALAPLQAPAKVSLWRSMGWGLP